MALQLVICSLVALLAQAQAQVCNSPKIPVPSPAPTVLPAPLLPTPVLSPVSPVLTQYTPTPLISTTVVDNSVANSLANALQLLIVSELIENSIRTPIYPYSLQTVGNVGVVGTVDLAPVVDVYAPLDVDVTVAEVVPATLNVVPVTEVEVDISAPVITTVNPFGGMTEIVNPIGPVVPEFMPYGPYGYNPALDVLSVTEINPAVPVAPINPYYYTDMVAPFTPYVTEVKEVVGPVKPVNTVVPLAPTVNPYYVDVVPQFKPCVTEVVGPVKPVFGYPETYQFPGFPFAAEVILPQSIPAQIKCNFGYPPQPIAEGPIVDTNTVSYVY